MPVRARVGTALAEQVVGAQVWNGLYGECKTMPTDAYDETVAVADVLYERIVDMIDWNRVLIEASSRHLNLVRDGNHRPLRYNIMEAVCGFCIQEALLTDEHMPRHSPVPLPRHDQGQDWLKVMAEMRQKYGRGFTKGSSHG